MSKPFITRDGQQLKVGDIVTCYYKGYWRVKAINYTLETYRQPHYDHWLVDVEPVLDSKFRPRKGKVKRCDATYCKIMKLADVVKERDEMIQALKDGYANLCSVLGR